MPVGIYPRKPMIERFWEKVIKSSDRQNCWLWVGQKNKKGYGIFRLDKDKLRYKAHRVSWELNYGDIPEGLCVCHKCDNPSCVNPDHLFLGTNQDNTKDMVSKNRQCWGEHNPRTKLRADEVLLIKQFIFSGQALEMIASIFNVKLSTIRDIKYNRTWRHII